MKAVIHIGTEKTGSTSIQNFLLENRQALIQEGFYYPKSLGALDHRKVSAYCLENNQQDDFFKLNNLSSLKEIEQFKDKLKNDLNKEIKALPSNIHTVIISSEHLHSRLKSPSEIQNLHDLLSHHFESFEIICYLREQLDTCISFYSTALKSGNAINFENHLKNCQPNSHYYNYFTLLSLWENCFGHDAIRPSIFKEKEFINNDLIDDFTSKLSPNLLGKLEKNNQKLNTSLSHTGQHVLLSVNQAFPKGSDSNNTSIRDKCNLIISKNLKGKMPFPSDEQCKIIYDSFKESNQQLLEKYFPNKKVLFEYPNTSEDPSLQMDETLQSTLVELFTTIQEECSSSFLKPKNAMIFKEAALSVEESNLQMALFLMKLAHSLKPNGPLINKKIKEYQSRIKRKRKRKV